MAKEERDNGTPFLETLKYYLYYTHSPNDAAKTLCVHRNTLFYRINKIKQLTGVTLDNADERFQLYLSILLLEFSSISPVNL
ncbi:helix-turn-helix domain-containing protein [Dehalobacter sp. 4CP]|uniref:PucR family transcriptional regulator n=1 Tax=Dehalobacter sp. CP TaxID=2594474 RepID=UPI0039E79088